MAAHKLAIAEERIAELKERLNEMKRERDRAQAGEDAWKAQCEAVTRQLALPAPTNAQAALTPNTTPLSTGMAPVHSTAPAKRPGLLRRWLRSTG